MASVRESRSTCPSELLLNDCKRRNMAASAASTSCGNFCGSPSRSAASNFCCQSGNLIFGVDGGVSWSAIGGLLGDGPYPVIDLHKRSAALRARRQDVKKTLTF